MRNQVKSHVNKLKKKYEKDLVQRAKENPKVIWKYIKSKSKTRDGISDLRMNPADTKSPKTDIDEEKAKILAKYFLSVFTTETNGNVPNLELNQSINPISSLEISEENILKMLNTLKIDKSPGPDELHPRVLKEISSSITKPLYHIFKQSLEIGKLPLDWKTALVSAIFKKGNKSLVSNYRPVSLTSVVCKIMEKLVRSRILNRMKSQNLFTKRQYGFISGRSTSLQLLEVLDKWTEALDNGHYVDCIYMDFQKAFDKVPHNRLLEKIKSYGIVGPTLNWIKDFLKNRTQKVMVNGSGSEWENVTSGIPQGSVLGPILFVIYINDLPDTVESDSYLFADDTKIFRIIKGEDDKEILQDDLAKLEEWSDKWLLKFHPEKCKHMKISKSKNE